MEIEGGDETVVVANGSPKVTDDVWEANRCCMMVISASASGLASDYEASSQQKTVCEIDVCLVVSENGNENAVLEESERNDDETMEMSENS